jgi:hypothetical protein
MNLLNRWTPFTPRLDPSEALVSRKANMLTFLVIRFLLMCALVVGFSWSAFGLHP